MHHYASIWCISLARVPPSRGLMDREAISVFFEAFPLLRLWIGLSLPLWNYNARVFVVIPVTWDPRAPIVTQAFMYVNLLKAPGLAPPNFLHWSVPVSENSKELGLDYFQNSSVWLTWGLIWMDYVSDTKRNSKSLWGASCCAWEKSQRPEIQLARDVAQKFSVTCSIWRVASRSGGQKICEFRAPQLQSKII